MPVAQQVFIRHTFYGIILLICAGLEIVNLCLSTTTAHVIVKLIQIACLVVGMIFMMRCTYARKEKADELAQIEWYKARTDAMNVMEGIILLVQSSVLLLSTTIDSGRSIPVSIAVSLAWMVLNLYLGITNLMTGISFSRQERA